MLIRFMVKRIRITPTQFELELYDHETVIEDWNGGPDGWFRTRLSWLPQLAELRNWMSGEECRELAAVV